MIKSLFQLPFDRTTAARGHQLHQSGGVLRLHGDAHRIEAHIVENDRPQTVTFLNGSGETWRATCTCAAGDEGRCVHAHAAMQAVLQKVRRREPLQPIPETAVAAIPDEESVFRAALEQAFFAYRPRRALSNAIVAFVAPDWPEVEEREWHPWPPGEAPQTPDELWQYIALALNEGGHPIPDFMLPFTRLAETAARTQEAAARSETKRWEEAIAAFTASTPLGRPEQVSVRLSVGFDFAFFKWRAASAPESEPFRAAEKEDLQRFMSLGRQSLLVVEPPSALALWLAYLNYWHSFQELELDCSLPRTRKILNGLFAHPELAPFLVNRDDVPFRRGPRLAWECRRAEDGSRYLVQLAAPGEPAPARLMHLPGATSLYLSNDTLFEGPATGNFLTGDRYNHILPASVVEARAGIDLLHRLGIEPPEHLRARVRHVPMRVEILCEIETKGFKHPHEELSVLARAVAEDGGRVEVLARDQWVLESESPAGADEPLPLYDHSRLAQVPALLSDAGLKPGRFDSRWRRRLEGDFPVQFAAWLRNLPEGVTALIHDAQLATLRQGPLRPKLTFEVRSASAPAGGGHAPTDWFDLNLDLDVDDTKLTATEMKLLLRARGNYVRLKGKGWRRLELDLDQNMQQRLAQLGIDPEDFANGPQRLHALQLASPDLGALLDPIHFAALKARCEQLVSDADRPTVPDGITADLRPYQIEGFQFLSRLSRSGLGGILADDMGLGKTVQALVWLTWLRAQNEKPGPALVVCPKSVMENWSREAIKFAPNLRVCVLHPKPGTKLPEPDPNSADLFVVNYAQLRRRAEFYTKTPWLAVILDEGQNIKNPDSQSARTVRALQSTHRLVLTGTPIENRLLDLWSLMAFTTPGILGQRTYFERQFEKKDDPLARQRVAARLRPFLLRRTKREVAPDLPPRIEEDQLCELEGTQRDLYRAELKRARGLLMHIESAAEFHEQRFHILQSLLRLRQICCHPGLIDPSRRGETSAKLEALFDVLEPLREEGHKVLVFSQFVSMLDIIRDHLNTRGWGHHYLTGQTENRAEVVDSFSASPDPSIFLLSLKAAGSGLNLMAASYVVLFDPWWNPAVEAQAIDRTHRIGQANQVIAYRLLVKDSVEEKIRGLQTKKAALASDVLGLGGDGSSSLDWRDFDFLLGGDDE